MATIWPQGRHGIWSQVSFVAITYAEFSTRVFEKRIQESIRLVYLLFSGIMNCIFQLQCERTESENNRRKKNREKPIPSPNLAVRCGARPGGAKTRPCRPRAVSKVCFWVTASVPCYDRHPADAEARTEQQQQSPSAAAAGGASGGGSWPLAAAEPPEPLKRFRGSLGESAQLGRAHGWRAARLSGPGLERLLRACLPALARPRRCMRDKG